MSRKLTIQDQVTDFLLYSVPNRQVKIEVLLNNETLWLNQQKIADLFAVQRPAISKHLKNIFESHELEESVVCSILEHTTQHGALAGKTQAKAVKYYNLDAIISVGYRVNSSQATQFRIWATQLLKEFIIFAVKLRPLGRGYKAMLAKLISYLFFRTWLTKITV